MPKFEFKKAKYFDEKFVSIILQVSAILTFATEGFYCILSGMKNILISSGIEVLKGEPIAKLNNGKNNQLYFELRLNGKIVNPKSKVEIL